MLGLIPAAAAAAAAADSTHPVIVPDVRSVGGDGDGVHGIERRGGAVVDLVHRFEEGRLAHGEEVFRDGRWAGRLGRYQSAASGHHRQEGCRIHAYD